MIKKIDFRNLKVDRKKRKNKVGVVDYIYIYDYFDFFFFQIYRKKKLLFPE